MPPHLRQGSDIVSDMDHTPESRSSAGPIVGTIIIVILLVLGALYFWGAQLNRNAMKNQLPIIPGDATTTAL